MNAVAPLKTPPHSIEAEQSVLGSLLVDNGRWDEVCSRMGEDDLYRADHRTIWRAMAELSKTGAPFDAVTVAEYLQRQGTLDQVGGLAHLAVLARDVPTSVNAAAYAGIVHDRAVQRGAIRIANQLTQSIGQENAVDVAIQSLMQLEQVGRDWEHSSVDMMRRAIDTLDKLNEAGTHIMGVRSGISDLDDKLGGFHPGDLIVVGARPSVGKTALMLNWAAKSGEAVGVISSEQPSEQIAMRLISLEGGVSVHKMRRGQLEEEDWNRVTAGMGKGSQLPIWLNDNPAINRSELVRQARKWKQQRRIKSLYVDYIQRIQPDNTRKDIREGVIEVVRGLKSLARELDIPVIALAQVKREVDTRENKRPMLSDLQESGAIEQEADEIILIYRDEVYHPETLEKGIAELNIAKNRHGPTGVIKVAWHGELMRFGNLAREQPRDAWSGPA